MWRMCVLRRCRRTTGVALCAGAALYALILLLGDFGAPVLTHLTDLHRCPACYGISICPELYSGSVALDAASWTRMFNAKNVYYGSTRSGKRIVLKKLAHDWEFREFDKKLCSSLNLTENCMTKDLLNITNMERFISDVIKFDFNTKQNEAKNGLILCPYTYGLPVLIQPVVSANKHRSASGLLINVWTMLKINPEPIILQLLPASAGWPTPVFGGVCGRLALVTHSGDTLTNMKRVPWMRRLRFADQILKAAMDFTFKHDRFRFYLMDWSLDNIAVDSQDRVTFIDLEDVIVIDKHITPGPELPAWYMRYNREQNSPGYTFSIEKMCRHHLSDHNLWAACFILAGDDDSLLLPIPESVNRTTPYLFKLLNDCVSSENKFKTVSDLQRVISDLLNEENR